MEFTNEEMQRRVINYRNYPCDENEKELMDFMETLAVWMLLQYKADPKLIHRDDVACYAMDRLERFDPEKGKAFNYFTTVMGCFIRQIQGDHKRKMKLREKYQESLNKTYLNA